MSESGDSARRKTAFPSQSSALVELVERQGVRLFNDGAGEAFATGPGGETWPVPSRPFAAWLRRLLYEHGKRAVARESAVREAVQLLEARALYAEEAMPVFVRVARMADSVYVDLGDSACRIVEITGTGWRVIGATEASARFRRPTAMLALPEPTPGGRLDELRPHLNLAGDDEQWSLVAAFLVASIALAPRGPFPVLIFHGEHGCMKTSCTEHCSELVDPRRAGLRALPHDLENLAVAAHNGYLLAFDNVSAVEPAMSDGLCRLATGAGYAKRTHYENRDESIFDAARPVIMNSIGQAVVRADLIDRSVFVELPNVPESRRRTKREVAARFAAARPRILGGLFDAVSHALAGSEMAAARLSKLPRMADFAVIAVAAEPAMGVPPGTFMRAYGIARRSGAETAAGADPVAIAVRDFVVRHGTWEGSASELLAVVERPANVHQRSWPDSATKMGSCLVRLRPVLPTLGIEAIQLPRRGEGRRWLLSNDASTSPFEIGVVSDAADPSGDTGSTPKKVSVDADLSHRDAGDAFPRPSLPQPSCTREPPPIHRNGATATSHALTHATPPEVRQS